MLFAIIISFLGKFTALISTIPSAVLGGVSLLLYGFIAVNGLKVLIKNQVDFENNRNVVVASSMLVIGLGGAVVSIVSGNLSITISGMSLASIVGIILNLIIKEKDDSSIDVLVDEKKYTSLKNEIKDEILIELRDEIKKMKFVKVEKKKSSKRKSDVQ